MNNNLRDFSKAILAARTLAKKTQSFTDDHDAMIDAVFSKTSSLDDAKRQSIIRVFERRVARKYRQDHGTTLIFIPWLSVLAWLVANWTYIMMVLQTLLFIRQWRRA